MKKMIKNSMLDCSDLIIVLKKLIESLRKKARLISDDESLNKEYNILLDTVEYLVKATNTLNYINIH